MPAGVHWTPVDEALEHLEKSVGVVVEVETVPVSHAGGRILAKDVFAERANPPYSNAAVDGYGFAHSTSNTEYALDLVNGRSAAGSPYNEGIPKGAAIRILTGAKIPAGVDTVVMQEDVNVDQGKVYFQGQIKFGSNVRPLGEDIAVGQKLLAKGHKLRAPDIATCVAAGLSDVAVYRPLRVGVLSTGDELCAVGQSATADQIMDSNRPMLLDILRKWGVQAVDLGHIADDLDLCRQTLNASIEKVDVVLTTGGASAGDEDHISKILKEEGTLNIWRIAIKPGRPLALGMWRGVPVFGLPGNSIAAFVCAIIFARPTIMKMAGGCWSNSSGYMCRANFAKSKKNGRREYLRARRNQAGDIEIFQSEGSGRISGLSWATGLVELPDHALEINQGDLVRYHPFSDYGL